jgi:hypothetical protein
MFKALGIALLLTAATAAYAQQNTTVTPVQVPPHPALQIVPDHFADSRVDVEVGSVRLISRSGRYTFAYLPVLPPLPGTAFRPSIEMPNAFELTGMSIPQKPRSRQQHVLAGIR